MRSPERPSTVTASWSIAATVAPALASTVMASVRCEVRNRTRVPEAPATRSATLVSATSRPRPMTTRWSAVSSSSLIRWLETRIARPSAASDRRYPRIHLIPSGSRPFTGSSNISTGGSPSIAAAMPRRCRMPSENPPARLRATAVSPTCSSTSATRRAGRPLLWAIHSRWSRARRAGMDRARVEKGTDLGEGRRQRPVRPAADRCRSCVGRVEPEHDAHRRGLPGPVGADEPGDLARAHREGEVLDRDSRAVPLP